MADVYYNVTLSTAEAGSGPNYDVSYSNDCVTYLPATPSTVTLESVGSQATITIPDTTQCVKLTNINSNCTNSVSSSVTPTTTTTTTSTTTTTTIAPTTTTTTAAGTTPTTTIARRFDWNFIESGGARGQMYLYINGAQVENRTITSSGFYNVNVGDTISCAVATDECGQAANAYCIGIINDASCASGNTSFVSSTYTVLSTDTFIVLSMYSTCDTGCV
jgi:hypothetical protein